MLGYPDLSGSDPCSRCGSDSGDCDWARRAPACSASCSGCGGTGVGRCKYCDEVVPCSLERGRNPRPDAACAWDDLARLHAEDCRWARSRGGDLAPIPADIVRFERGLVGGR